MPSVRTLFSLFLAVGFLTLLAPVAPAQDDFSLDDDDPSAAVDGNGRNADGTKKEVQARSMGEKILRSGLAMWLLILLSIVWLGLTIYLIMDLQKKNFTPPELEMALDDSFSQADMAGGLNMAMGSQTCLGAMVSRGVEYLDEREATAVEGEEILDHMADASMEHNQKRAFLINMLSVIAQAAPMLGLLGTVSGMIGAFAALGDAGAANPQLLADKISEALFTTFAGLLLALPAIFTYQFLRNRLTNLVTATTRSAQTRIRALRRAVLGGAMPPAGDPAQPINPSAPPLPPA